MLTLLMLCQSEHGLLEPMLMGHSALMKLGFVMSILARDGKS